MSLLTILLYIICLILILIFLFLIIGLQFHIFLEFHDDFFGKIEVNIFKKIKRKKNLVRKKMIIEILKKNMMKMKI